jgi:hypothetical protein
MDQGEKPSRTSGGTRGVVLGLFGSNIFSLFVAGLYEFLALRGVINMMAAWVVLLATWLIGVIGICLSEWVWGGTMKQRFWTGSLAAVILGIVLFGLNELVDHIAATAQTTAPDAAVSSEKQNGGQTAGSIVNQGPVYNGPVNTMGNSENYAKSRDECPPNTQIYINGARMNNNNIGIYNKSGMIICIIGADISGNGTAITDK